MELLLFWVMMAIICAIVGSSKGRSGFLYFLGGLLCWPIVLVVAMVAKDKRITVEPTMQSPPPLPAQATEFHADGIINQRPYRQNADGSVTVMMQGQPVRFRSIEEARTHL